jgi:hypothetical protein
VGLNRESRGIGGKGRRNTPIAVHIIIKCQLFVLLDIAFGEDAHTDILANSPFRDVAVGIAAVVCEAPDPPVLRCVDELHRDEVEVERTKKEG